MSSDEYKRKLEEKNIKPDCVYDSEGEIIQTNIPGVCAPLKNIDWFFEKCDKQIKEILNERP